MGHKRVKQQRREERRKELEEKLTVKSEKSYLQKAMDTVSTYATRENLVSALIYAGGEGFNFLMKQVDPHQRETMSFIESAKDVIGYNDISFPGGIKDIPGANFAKNYILDEVTGINNLEGVSEFQRYNKEIGQAVTATVVHGIFKTANKIKNGFVNPRHEVKEVDHNEKFKQFKSQYHEKLANSTSENENLSTQDSENSDESSPKLK